MRECLSRYENMNDSDSGHRMISVSYRLPFSVQLFSKSSSIPLCRLVHEEVCTYFSHNIENELRADRCVDVLSRLVMKYSPGGKLPDGSKLNLPHLRVNVRHLSKQLGTVCRFQQRNRALYSLKISLEKQGSVGEFISP